MQFAQRLLATRGGTIALSGVAAVLAAVVLLAYLHRYRESIGESSQPMTVLVAKDVIEKGTPGAAVGSNDLFQVATTPRSEVKEGAITDPASLRGKVAIDDIYPGQQLTLADFSATGADALGNQISEDERAISVPIDAAHGMVGNVQAGDHVDLFAGLTVKRLRPDGTPDPDAEERPVVKLLVEDVLVLDAPSEKGSVGAGGQQIANVTLRVPDEDAAKVAFAADNGKVWIVLRPRTGATQSAPDIVSVETVLFGAKPVAVARSFGARR
ncbi:MAG: Flp pilus assembly protein CpaB [Actinomycetota bacterium]|nr:Flp pilus assembly protein CpaB [Actinomycetota bacterium]